MTPHQRTTAIKQRLAEFPNNASMTLPTADLAWLIARVEKLEAVVDAAKAWRDCDGHREDEYASLLLKALSADGEGSSED